MTACVNKRRALAAALAGVLALGGACLAAPALAFAEGASAQANVAAKDAFDAAAVAIDAKSPITYDGQVHAPKVTSVTPKGGAAITGVQTSDDYKVYYVKADSKGAATDEVVAQPVDAGKYCVVVEAVSGAYEGGKATASFEIVGQALSGAAMTTTSYVYDAEAVEPEFTLSGKKLVEGVDYTVKYYASGDDYTDSSKGSETAPTDAGSYYARLTGKGAYTGNSGNITFSITAYTFNATDAYVPYIVETSPVPSSPTTVKGSSDLASHFKLTYTGTVGAAGKYTATVSKANPQDANVTVADNTTIDVYKVKSGMEFTYGGSAIADMTINLANKESYDQSKVAATYVDANGETQNQPLVDGNFTYYKLNADGTTTACNKAALATPGTYVVEIQYIMTTGYTHGGNAQFKVTVISGAIDCAAGLYVSYDNDGDGVKEVVSSVVDTWSNTDIMPSISVSLYNGKTQVSSSLVHVTYTDASGNAVSEIKDAGTYTGTVTADGYQLSNNTFTVTVEKLTVAQVRIAKSSETSLSGATLVAINGKYQLRYTGSELKPVVQYTTGERDAQGELVWHAFDNTALAEAKLVKAYVTLSYAKGGAASKVKDKGEYTLTATASAAVDAKNLEVAAPAYKFSVAESKLFQDVSNDAWYAEYVEQANLQGYMKGYLGTSDFGPEGTLTRAQAAQVLYNMSGAYNSDNNVDENGGDYSSTVNLPYTDTDGKAWYAVAVQWATKYGVVTGYQDGTGRFDPDAPVTREQFAVMLARYAKLHGEYDASGAAEALATMKDASSVSSWAAEACGWAVSEEIMGANGVVSPSASITRAEVAKMVTVYQPAAI